MGQIGPAGPWTLAMKLCGWPRKYCCGSVGLSPVNLSIHVHESPGASTWVFQIIACKQTAQYSVNWIECWQSATSSKITQILLCCLWNSLPSSVHIPSYIKFNYFILFLFILFSYFPSHIVVWPDVARPVTWGKRTITMYSLRNGVHYDTSRLRVYQASSKTQITQ